MKRNSLFTKLLAMMLCVMMVVGCLPLSALADASDWESDIDIADPIPGSEEAPIDLTADLVTEGDKAATVTVPAGETVYYQASRLAGMIMTINGGEGVMCTGDNWTPYVWYITNDGTEDAEYEINVDFPVGTMNNPQDLSADASETVTLEAGSEGWYFDFMAYENGYVTFTISGDNWQWQVTNNSTSVQDELYTSVVEEGEEVKNSLTYKYTAEDEYVIMVNTYDPEDTWNAPAGDVTVEVTFVSGWGTEQSPYQLTELENYVTIGANETVYYYGYFSGMNMTVSGNENFVVNYNGEAYADTWGSIEPIAVDSGNPRMPISFSVTNNSGEEASYYIGFTYPEGTMNNPQDLWDGSNEHTFAEGDMAYYYDYIGYSDGYLTITVSGDCGWQYVINNNTAGVYGDRQFSDSDPLVTTQTFKYFAGEEYVVEIATYDPADMWAAPAGTINVEISFEPGFGTEESPYQLTELENDVTIADGDPVYYTGRFAGMNMTVAGTGDFSVILDGVTYAAVDGVVVIENLPGNNWMPPVFAIDGSGEFTVSFAFPAGHSENPAVAVLGDNTASVAAGTQGYFWTYTAEKDGELNVTISGADNWTYQVNNMTTFVYGDMQWSDSDPVVNPTVIEVAAGDVIRIVMNGYDPANPWEAPAATLTINLAYTPEGPEVDPNLKFTNKGLSFQDYIGIQNTFTRANAADYDRYYVEAVQKVWNEDGTVSDVVTILEPIYLTKKLDYFDAKILAWSMTEEITLTIYAVKGDVLYQGEVQKTSVEQMAMSMIENYAANGNVKACTLLVDMLNYGATVQTTYDHNETVLPNANLGEYASYATAVDPTFSATNNIVGSDTIRVRANSVSMQDKVEIQFAFRIAEVDGYELRYTVGGVTDTISATEFTPISSSLCVARIAVKAANMRETYTVALYNSTTGEIATAEYNVSVEAYGKSYVGNATYNDVVIAMMKYGDSVAAL